MQKRDLAKHNILSWLKTFNKLDLEGMYLNKIKATCNKFSDNNILKNKKNKSFFYIYEDNHIVFNFQFGNVVYHTDWHADIEKSSHPWDKSHLIMVYEPFNELLDSVW